MTSISLRSAQKCYPAAKIDATIDVASGQRLALLGPSGCGKSTVLAMVAGLVELDAGDVCFDNVSMRSVPPERRGAAMVFQDHALFPFHTVAENVAYGLKLRGIRRAERDRRADQALETVRLGGFGPRWPSELSGGERQRVALARAMVIEPQVLLLDEPLSSLDPELRSEVRDAIDTVQRALAITTIVVTHDHDEARRLGDKIAIMDEGMVVQIAAPDEPFSKPARSGPERSRRGPAPNTKVTTL